MGGQISIFSHNEGHSVSEYMSSSDNINKVNLTCLNLHDFLNFSFFLFFSFHVKFIFNK